MENQITQAGRQSTQLNLSAQQLQRQAAGFTAVASRTMAATQPVVRVAPTVAAG